MLNKNSVGFILLLAALVAIPPLSTDVGLPAFGATAASFHVPTASVALTLSFFMLGFAVGPLFYGPASERYGRKPILLGGLILYFLTSILCTLTPSFLILLFSRLLQGFAASAGSVLAIACIRDLFEGDAARRRLSYTMMINGLMPLTAPTLGAIILALGNWRSIYGLMVVSGFLLMAGVFFGQPESLRRKNPNALKPSGLIAGYKAVLRHPVSFRASLINAMSFGTMFAFISGSPILLMQVMHLPAAQFALYFAIPVVGTIAGTFGGNLMQRRSITSEQILTFGLILMTGATLILLLLNIFHVYAIVLVIGLIWLSNCAMGMIGPCASYAAVQYLPQLAGQASAILSSTQMVIGALSSSLVALLFAWVGPSAMAAEMFGFAALAAILFFTRPNAPEHA
ncbi:MAG: multidrug effflux MFS transporter [Rhizomicrobium sp.]